MYMLFTLGVALKQIALENPLKQMSMHTYGTYYFTFEILV